MPWGQNLIPGQRRHLKALGLTPLPAAPAKKKTPTAGAFEREVLVLQQYKNRSGTLTVLRAHIETVIIDDEEHLMKFDVSLMN
ncbi:hypothetical protein AB0D56_36350 [Streptomyces sp. NPDC048209]|uniref:hypothetical protein n=1 Tax=Streptomyces TaxID=1883 RepID=UPI0034249BDC